MAVIWKLKSCPRCGGDLYIASDMDGWFSQCLQCSHWRELGGPVAGTMTVAERGKTTNAKKG